MTFKSAVATGTELERSYGYHVPSDQYINGLTGRQFVRKAQSDFGWDWGPAFAPMGVI